MTARALPVPPTGEWAVERLDLDAYLDRIDYAGPRAASLGTLRAIHRAHVAAIPFENLDVILGRGTSVDLGAVQEKLVARRRGGYCYEHAILLGAALERLGFDVERLLVRTGDPLEHPRPRAHAVLRVSVDGEPWLVDAGYGSGLLEPIPFAPTGPHRQGVWKFELVRGDDGYLRLRRDAGKGWNTEQTLTDDRIYLVDYAVANANTSTSPASPFTQAWHVVRVDAERERSLHGREYRVEVPGRVAETHTVLDDGLGVVLSELGLDLAGHEIAGLLAFVREQEQKSADAAQGVA